MSMNVLVRRSVAALACVAASDCGSGGGDATGPTSSPPTVTLTVTPSSVTTPGDIDLTAAAYGANGVGLRKVEFYERLVNVDASPRKIGEDADAPYEVKRSILSDADNGTREFTAKAYDAAGQMGTSNSSMVVVSVAPTPLQVNASASQERITTPGAISITAVTNRPFSRAELYDGATKVAEVAGPLPRWVANIAVTAANNGTRTYVVKAYSGSGNVAESAPVTVVVDIRWDFIRTVDGIRSHERVLVATDAANSVYLAGGTETWGVFIIKYDALGNQLWTRNFGGADTQHPKSIGVDASGRVFVAGTVLSSTGRYDCSLELYDAAGTLLRVQLVDIPGGAGFCVAASDRLGNLYVAGGAYGGGFLIKYDRDGSALWTQRFGGTAFPSSEFPNDALTSIAVDASGGVYVGGYTGQSFDGAPNRGPRDTFVLKFDADGNRLWSTQYGSSGVLTFAEQLAADPEGGVYVSGQTDDPNNRFVNGKGFVLRFGADGALLWARVLDGGGDANALGVAADLRGVSVVGTTNRGGPNQQITEPTQGGYDAFFAQFSRDGNLLSVRLIGSPAQEFANGVAIGANGDIYVAGTTADYQPGAFYTFYLPFLARYRDVPP